MPSEKISAMNSLASVDDATLFPVVDGGVNWSTTALAIKDYIGSGGDAVTSVTVVSPLTENSSTGDVVIMITGVVTDVSGVSPISSTGGTTPALSISAADATHDGIVTQVAQTFSGAKTFTDDISTPGRVALEDGVPTETWFLENAANEFDVSNYDASVQLQLSSAGLNVTASGGSISLNGSPIGGMANPMTNEGDIIYQSAGSPAALAIGSNGSVLTSNGTDPTWQDLNEFVAIGSPVSFGTNYNVLTIDVSGNLSQISPSTDGYVLTSNGTSAAPTFMAPADVTPMTTEGDMTFYNVGSAVRLPIGTTGQVLTVISGDPVWSGVPAPGSTGEVIFNSSGAMAASSAMTYSGYTLTLQGDGATTAPNLQIFNSSNANSVYLTVQASGITYNFVMPPSMGTAGQFLQSDGTSHTTFANPDAAPITYTASTPSDWASSSPPTTLAAALDRIAAALTTLGQAP